jgi:hypothetical protein
MAAKATRALALEGQQLLQRVADTLRSGDLGKLWTLPFWEAIDQVAREFSGQAWRPHGLVRSRRIDRVP